VMQFNAGEHLAQLRHRAQNIRALGGMRLHDLEFFGSQSAGLFQNAIFDADLADIVELS